MVAEAMLPELRLLAARVRAEARSPVSGEAVAALRGKLVGVSDAGRINRLPADLVAEFEAAVRAEAVAELQDQYRRGYDQGYGDAVDKAMQDVAAAVAAERQRIAAAVAEVAKQRHWLEQGHDDGYREAVSRCVAAAGSVPRSRASASGCGRD